MDTLLLSVIIGIVAGTVDIIPMIVQKLSKHSIGSAFSYYFLISVIIVNIDLPHIAWWIEGGLIATALIIPIMIQVSATERKPLSVMIINAIILGTLIGMAGHYLTEYF